MRAASTTPTPPRPPPAHAVKADQVRSRLATDFTGWEHDNAKFEYAFERLVKARRRDAAGVQVAGGYSQCEIRT